MTPPAVPKVYWHNWADSAGVSHLTECSLTNWTFVDFLPNSDPLYLDNVVSGDSASVVWMQLPVGWKGPFHKDPVPQLVLFMSGEGTWETMDNKTHVFTVGQVYFGEDQRSLLGHISANTGNSPLIMALLQFKGWQPTVNQPCRLK